MEGEKRYKTYRSRWLVLLTVTLLNLSNNALWISYSAVAPVATEYFDKTVNQIDLLATISFYVGIPMCLVSTYVVDTLGLRTGMMLGTGLTFIGGLIRALSTLPGLNKEMSLDTQFLLSVVGQALTGMGNPLAVSVPTKVSQNWFPESERLMATGVLAMSLPLGIILGQGVSPFFVKEAEDIPLMNLVWLGPALLTLVCCLLFVRTSDPPTPPSLSAELAASLGRKPIKEYLQNMKKVLTNGTYLIIFFVIGGAVGFFNCISTQLSQLMGAQGYSTEFSGICGSLLLGTGFIGAIITGVAVEKWGHMEDIAKVCFGFAALCGIVVAELMRFPDMHVGIALGCSLFGVFGFGVYPLGLELSVEATYPVDESIGTALIFLSGQLQGGILVVLSELLEEDLSDDSITSTPTFTPSGTTSTSPGQSPATTEAVPDTMKVDHTRFLMVVMGYLAAIVLVWVFLKTKFKRTLANEGKAGNTDIPMTTL